MTSDAELWTGIDRQRFSAIAHGDMAYWNPVDPAFMESVLTQAGLPEGASVLDIGCGRGTAIRRLAELCPGVAVAGIDTSQHALNLALDDKAASPAGERIEFLYGEYDPAGFEHQSFALVLCLGSTHALGGYEGALVEARRLLLPGGAALIGEGYWRKAPHADYLDFLGAKNEAQKTHGDNIARARAAGFEVIDTHECSTREWDAYEIAYAANVRRYLEETPEEPDTMAMRARIDGWHAAYLRWGREVMGFGIYLLRKEE